jgi:hypothetical protein
MEGPTMIDEWGMPIQEKSIRDIQNAGRKKIKNANQIILDLKQKGITLNATEPKQAGDDLIIQAFKGSKKVGTLRVADGGHTIAASDVSVDEKFRRMGIATAMYVYAEKLTGKKMSPASDQAYDFGADEDDIMTPEARKFWDQPNRPFGENVNEWGFPLSEKLVLSNYKEYQKKVSDAYLARPKMETQYLSSWKALAQHAVHMFDQIATRIDIEFTKEDPYPNYQAMAKDIDQNHHMAIFSGGTKHPVFTEDENLKLRAVHDYMIHFGGGHEFGLRGEIGAYNRHAKVAPKAALLALFTEVVGQACVSLETGTFPEQKICKLWGFDLIEVGKIEENDYLKNFPENENPHANAVA